MTYPYKLIDDNTTSLKSNFLCEVNSLCYSYRLSRHIQQSRGNKPRLTCAPKHIEMMLRFALTNERYGTRIVNKMKSGGGKARLALVYFDEAKGYKVGVLCAFERRYGNTSEITLITMMDKPSTPVPLRFQSQKKKEEIPAERCQKTALSEETSLKWHTWTGILGVIFRRIRKGLCRVMCG